MSKMNKAARNNRANQLNPNNSRYQPKKPKITKADRDNHANQLNPNNSRFQPKKPKSKKVGYGAHYRVGKHPYGWNS